MRDSRPVPRRERLRLAIPDDFEAVSRVVRAAYGRYVARIGREPGPMRDDHAALIGQGCVHVAERDGIVQGVVVLIAQDDCLLLHNVAVLPDAQGSGLGRTMLRFAEVLALRREYRTIRLYANEAMVENIALYTRLGYVETGRGVESGYRRVHMAKRLDAGIRDDAHQHGGIRMKTWLITGCSAGFGRILAEAAASRGDTVVATARKPATLDDLVARHPERIRATALDVTDAASAAAAVGLAEREFGGLDILVNNAGYGLVGGVEETEPGEYRPMFEANVFGLIETTRAALPALRRRPGGRPGGRIVNFSSGAGIVGSAGSGYYCATKFAVEGLSEALAEEVAPFGLRVIIVEPGPFRTDFLGRSITVAAREMPEYADTVGKRRHYRSSNDGRQAGDPDKAIAIVLAAVDAEAPPLHLPIGPVAHATAERKLASFRADIDAWRDRSIATDFD